MKSEDCSGHGVCGGGDANDGKCDCVDDYTGEGCDKAPCDLKCKKSGHGVCKLGACVCHSGWGGDNCEERTCDNDCSGHGDCSTDRTCTCEDGWSGHDCSLHVCPHKCSDHGHCYNGTCYCLGGFTGQACQTKVCPDSCSGHGMCVEGVCSCHEGFQGKSCSVAVCPSKTMFDECSGHGACVLAHLGADTKDDAKDDAKDEANGTKTTTTIKPKCFCEEGFTGSDCSLLGCSEECTSAGDAVCRNGVCYCRPGMGGDHCTRTLCERDCHGHGSCKSEGLCECDDGWRGKNCETSTCSKTCNEEEGGVATGVCEKGVCKCLPGYTGENCKQKTCGVDCNEAEGWGYCNGHDGQCYCESGYGGIDCSILLVGCPNNCNGRGACRGSESDGSSIETSIETPERCHCEDGYSGIACEVKACPIGVIQPHHALLLDTQNASVGNVTFPPSSSSSPLTFLEIVETTKKKKKKMLLLDVCSRHGVCAPGIGGLCECGAGYYGADCSCTHDCFNGGECSGGVCLCAYGWRGLNCSHTICPNDCSHRGKCVDESCECDVGFGGDGCSERRCPNSCSGHGLCDGGICICNYGHGGQDCGLEFHGNLDDMICSSSESFLNAFYNYRRVQLELASKDVDFSSLPRLNNDLQFATKSLFARQDDLREATSTKSKEYGDLTMRSVDLILLSDKQDREELQLASMDEKKINMTAVRVGKGARRKWRSELNGIIGMCVKDVPCPHNCTSHVDGLTSLPSGGYCVEGMCKCYPGWGGEDCGERECFKDCNLHGACRHGICECDKNWEGPYCTIFMDFECRESCSAKCDDLVTIDSEAGGVTPEKESCKQKCFRETCAAKKPMLSKLPLGMFILLPVLCSLFILFCLFSCRLGNFFVPDFGSAHTLSLFLSLSLSLFSLFFLLHFFYR